MTVGLLILWLTTVLAMAILLSLVVAAYIRRNRRAQMIETGFDTHDSAIARPRYVPSVFDNPCRWLAVKSTNVTAVQGALGLHNPMPCSWDEGIARLTDHSLFVSPPIEGWILVVGQALPDPTEDPDECFRFILELSRELGHVQLFSAHRAVNHHAWVRAERERIVRAYVWAGETLWNQGTPTAAETDLGMECFAYGEEPEAFDFTFGEPQPSNADKVTFLAGRWSLDPTSLDASAIPTALGVAGEFTHSKPH